MDRAESKPAWSQPLLRNPHAAPDKRQRVRRMFAAIAPSYDLNNRLHSLWQDQRWRRKAVKLANLKPTDTVVDVACGTGDLTLKFADFLWRIRPHQQMYAIGKVFGIDFTLQMLPIAREKARHVMAWGIESYPRPTTLARSTEWIAADAQALPLPNACCDVASIAFGIRNVQDPAGALREFHRVLRPGGRVIILEFSLPSNRILRGMYNFYFRRILPLTATLISHDRTGAYRYLPESVNTFIGRDQMMQMIQDAGFQNVEAFPMTFGVCVCYRAMKPSPADQ
jgi:demethylmenaquinone methyltransferase/2-methoxy-6-polyprenyl-1,4-benzoquinol methylase